ncbi:MAG: hypothetical protein C0483_04150 [Pirellula sp.]|nr:hypothetical protein [Pirellula sp.]
MYSRGVPNKTLHLTATAIRIFQKSTPHPPPRQVIDSVVRTPKALEEFLPAFDEISSVMQSLLSFRGLRP